MSRNSNITIDKLNKTNYNNSIGYLYIILAKTQDCFVIYRGIKKNVP